MEKKETRLIKAKQGYGYKYTELAQLNEYCENNKIEYYQEIETSEINQKDYMITYVSKNGGEYVKHRGCQIVEATLQGIKNPVQQYGSSLTYCRRYSLLMALGLATEDDDGKSMDLKDDSKEKMTLLSKMQELATETDTDLDDMNNYYGVKTNKDMNIEQLKQCIKILETKKAKGGK